MSICAHLFYSKALLMHIAQVEHGLCAVLLLGRQTIMNDCRLIVHIGAIAVEMIVT